MLESNDTICIKDGEGEKITHEEVLIGEAEFSEESLVKDVLIMIAMFLVPIMCIAFISFGLHLPVQPVQQHSPPCPPQALVVETVATCFIMLDPSEKEMTAILCKELIPRVGIIYPIPHPDYIRHQKMSAKPEIGRLALPKNYEKNPAGK